MHILSFFKWFLLPCVFFLCFTQLSFGEQEAISEDAYDYCMVTAMDPVSKAGCSAKKQEIEERIEPAKDEYKKCLEDSTETKCKEELEEKERRAVSPQGSSSLSFNPLSCSAYGPIGNAFCSVILSWVYLFFYLVPWAIAWGAAVILDYFVPFGIQGSTYELQFISFGWEILRDFSNIILIGALLLIGISLIMNLDVVSAKKKILTVFLVAVFVNFSFFFSLLIIDTGNLFAKIFYDRMVVTGTPSNTVYSHVGKGENVNLGSVEDSKPISVAILSKSDPQRVFKPVEGIGITEKLIMILAAGLFALVLVYVFFKAGFLLINRMVVLWIYTMLAPISMVVSALPPGISKHVPKGIVGFQTWLTHMISAALSAPIFFFFLYLILKVFNFGDSKDMGPDFVTGGILENIFTVMIPFVISTALLLFALKITKQLVSQGFIGGLIEGALGKVSGFASTLALGVATGGTGLAMRLGGKGLSRAGAWAGEKGKSGFASASAQFKRGGIINRTAGFGKGMVSGVAAIAGGLGHWGGRATTAAGGIPNKLFQSQLVRDSLGITKQDMRGNRNFMADIAKGKAWLGGFKSRYAIEENNREAHRLATGEVTRYINEIQAEKELQKDHDKNKERLRKAESSLRQKLGDYLHQRNRSRDQGLSQEERDNARVKAKSLYQENQRANIERTFARKEYDKTNKKLSDSKKSIQDLLAASRNSQKIIDDAQRLEDLEKQNKALIKEHEATYSSIGAGLASLGVGMQMHMDSIRDITRNSYGGKLSNDISDIIKKSKESKKDDKKGNKKDDKGDDSSE